VALTTDTTYSNAYRADNLGEVKPKILIGGKTEKFVPNVNISFDLESSKEQYFLNINRASVTVDKEISSLASDKLALSIGNEIDIWHIDENGHFKWDIEFAQKPSTNKFSWALTHTEGLEFAYQPALTQAEIDKGTVRPDEVVGSYAVYCGQSGHLKDADGNTKVNYRAGKLTHIYRPLCKDAKGNETWATLNISGNKLTITIPQKYLDNAVYPVTLDPTFGYTSVGASIGSSSNGSVYWALDANSPADGGTLTNVHVYMANMGELNDAFQMGFYSDNGGVPNSRLAYESSGTTHTNCPAWQNSTPDFSYSLTASTQYWVSTHSSNTFQPGYGFAYDSSGSKANRYRAADTTPPASAGTTSQDYSSAHFSVYATYTEGGGASSTPSSTPFLKPFRQAFGRGGF
jgi:hypothetical protein